MNRELDPIKGAIFDCDGTLLDSLGAWRGLEDEVSRLAGVTVTPEEHKMFTTFTIPEVARYFHEQYGLASSMEAVMGIMDEYMMSYYERAHLMPGAEAILESCARNNVKMSMASSSKPQFLWAGARATGIADYFSAIVSVEEVGASKREPAVYDRAREAMGTEKALTWGFEDALYAMDTLVKAGYPVFGLYDEAHGVPQVEVEKRARLAPSVREILLLASVCLGKRCRAALLLAQLVFQHVVETPAFDDGVFEFGRAFHQGGQNRLSRHGGDVFRRVITNRIS